MSSPAIRLPKQYQRKPVRLIILTSEDGEAPWSAVLPEEVPEWLKARHVIDHLMDGQMARCPGENNGRWYRAEQVRLDENQHAYSVAPTLH